MHANPLDRTLAELETLPSREKIRERVMDLERRATQQHSSDVQRFLRYIARPCLAGADNSGLIPEFDFYGQRFKRLWLRAK